MKNAMNIPTEKLIAVMTDHDDGVPLWWQGDSLEWMISYIDDFYKMDINKVPKEIFKRRKIFVWEGQCKHWDSANGPEMRGVWRVPTLEELTLLTYDQQPQSQSEPVQAVLF